MADHIDNDFSSRSADDDDHHHRPPPPGIPFFADATLDLETAHDIAETPEAKRKTISAFNTRSHAGVGAGVGAATTVSRRLDMPPVSLPLTQLDESSAFPPFGGGVGDVLLEDAHELVDDDDQNDPNNVQSKKTDFARITATLETSIPPPKHRPVFPRDLPWAVAFIIIVPFSLIWPILIEEHAKVDEISPLVRAPLSVATVHALWWGSVLTFFLSRFFYRTQAGPDGEDARHQIGLVLVGSVPLAIAVYSCLMVAILVWLPGCKFAIIMPMYFTLHNVFLLRQWRRRGDRQAFFQALSSMALDILSKSLRRASFFRVLSGLLIIQTIIVFIWRWALLGALGSRNGFVLLLAILGGKWATGSIARLLSLIASGGVINWFVEQSAVVAALQDDSNRVGGGNGLPEDHGGDSSSMPEAYRSVDASIYQSVLENDETIDDDDDFDDETVFETPSSRRQPSAAELKHKSTVKSLLAAGLTVSFGSVVQCGLLGGFAQFVWSQLRKVDAARSIWVRLRENSNGFSSMQVGRQALGNNGSAAGDSTAASLIKKLWIQFLAMARNFVRGHSDLAMSHVAAYYKNYHRAAKDVANLIDKSGVEPIIHDDITTHMCASVGGSVSGIIVIFTGYVLIVDRRSSKNAVSDFQVFEDMLLAFILCYTLIFTVMEPLRASIKAVYVSFAQHPRSLSQAYPLIFQRLRRVSESNIS
mmetsp:Transcript_1291/g.1725  ORF Transcript_1291/g.1725 Transcript_1291/m.1725 type:complete len:702 (+) Transcript_1291:102-2207(+)|eukprot:CAMPEP_0198148402 /NCGR_PEP_ID=MMETSP1443-20131203/41204_1 /TAXON_ID=186043 /ORGANISM="Entomoneis sp., Strain CCMP2396" /LENGTH=701 /DNA_ID=CAMNT_0043813077 /DNA_START=46 /DNA_END=2151 /DNA_ORIENTATION=-